MPFDWEDYLNHVEFANPPIVKKKRGDVSPYQIFQEEILWPPTKEYKTYHYGLAVIRRLRSYSNLEKRLFLEFQISQQQEPLNWLLQLSRIIEVLSHSFGNLLVLDSLRQSEAHSLQELIEEFFTRIKADGFPHQEFHSDATRKQEPNSRMNINEAAEYLDYSVSYLYKLTSDNKIPFHKAPGGRKLTFYRDELDEWLQKESKNQGKLGFGKT